MKPALLFDFNGVLIDDEEQHFNALQAVLREHAIDLSRAEYYTDYMGFDDRMCFVEAFRRAHRTPLAELMNHLIEAKAQAYERLMGTRLALVPGAVDFVTRAAPQFRLAVVSGALRREIENALDRAGLRRHFDIVVAAEDVRLCKPDPEGYLAARTALERTGTDRKPSRLPADRCIVVEDSFPGLEAARAAGMRCVMLTTTHPPERLRDADLVWTSFDGHDPAELLRLIDA
jgi:HAD superfamily hydrolase (TIGR01509 family)